MSSSMQRRRTDPGGTSLPIRALVVDDDDSYRAWVAAILRRHDVLVLSARDGDEAMAVLDGGEAFDLALVDCEMPRCDGMQLIHRIRSASETRELYSIMLTARDDVETKIAALTAGFDDFMAKSATELEIVAKLAACLRVAARNRQLDRKVHELYGQATRDELTGLANRRFFFEEGTRLLATAGELCVVMFDLDNFKVVNDTYGHLAGDRILRDVGALFLRATRQQDFVARLGGDEFAMIVTLPLEEAGQLAARLVSLIEAQQWPLGPETVRIGASVGLASAGLLESPSLEQLIEVCDQDLYKNKWLRKHPALLTIEPAQPPSEPADVIPFPEPRRMEPRQSEKHDK